MVPTAHCDLQILKPICLQVVWELLEIYHLSLKCNGISSHLIIWTWAWFTYPTYPIHNGIKIAARVCPAKLVRAGGFVVGGGVGGVGVCVWRDNASWSLIEN